jgi:NAD(P)-dependent dehydrogenase (short-subunit alcohol dehydrogenase family)
MPTVLVTGASRGIGKTIATHLAEKVAAVVEQSLTARRPRARYVVGLGPKLQLALMTRLPTGIRDRVLRGVARQPG